jgi:hypothetical protein
MARRSRAHPVERAVGAKDNRPVDPKGSMALTARIHGQGEQTMRNTKAETLAHALDLAYLLNAFDSDNGTATQLANDVNDVNRVAERIARQCSDADIGQALGLMRTGYEDCAQELLAETLNVTIAWDYNTRAYLVSRS